MKNDSTSDDFLTTRWSVIIAAKDEDSPEAFDALETLCRVYWRPLYVYIQSQGHNRQEAEDFTQGFFQRMLEPGFFNQVDRSKGRFRSFLLACLKHYLLDEYKYERRQKRGGGIKPLALDEEVLESELEMIQARETNPDYVFDQRWAFTVLKAALAKLQSEFESQGRQEQFSVLKPLLTGEVTEAKTDLICKKLKMTSNYFRVTLHRLRQRYRELIRHEIAETVSHPSEIDSEMRYLLNVITGR